MIEALAEAAAQTAAGSGIGWLGIPAGGLGAAALFFMGRVVRRGFTLKVDGEDEDATAKPPGFCPVHTEFSAKLDERHAAIMTALCEVKEGLSTIHRRIDDSFKS